MIALFWFQCPQMLEAHEELVEEFWFNSGLEKGEVEFHKYFCIEHVKGTWYIIYM